MPAEEYLPVADLTELSNISDDDYLVVQTAGQNGDVMLTSIESIISSILDLIYAPIASPEFTGTPTVPDIASLLTDDQQIANTSFVQAIAALKADADAPTITGQAHFSDYVPTTVVEGNTVQLATANQITTLTNAITSLTTSVNNLSSALSDKANRVVFSSKADFNKKRYGGSAAVMSNITPYVFRGEADFSTAILGTGHEGRCWGLCMCYSENAVHFVFMYGGYLYKSTWASSGNAFTTTSIG